jgi:lipopolysaccharide transport system ATP-binding protein
MHTTSTSYTAIRIRGLSKSYTIQKGGLEKQSTLTESALARLKNPLKRAEKETFHALKDIDLDIKKGEVVGIIGRNGAGKSTLLKVLSRITYPTTGQIDIYGRVGSLLEVGTGFHPELTGRENIYLNGAILGMTRPEITREFDAIVDFSGVEKFLDTPVKRYSSGMYVRLAFAVAAHLRTEILIVDEVLAVGDQDFQKKCLARMQKVSEDGRSVIFVSHNMASVKTLCQRAVFLKNGSIFGDGACALITNQYLSQIAVQSTQNPSVREDRRGDKTAWLSGIFINGSNSLSAVQVECGSEVTLRFVISGRKDLIKLKFTIYDNEGLAICQFDSKLASTVDDIPINPSELECRISELLLLPGEYRINTQLKRGEELADHLEGAASFEVVSGRVDERAIANETLSGTIYHKHCWIGQ